MQNDWLSKCFYRVSLKAVILNDQGQVLVVKEKNHTSWNLPGGGMDYGEDEHGALARELQEEVGYTDDFTYVPLGIYPMFLENKHAWQLWVVYKVTPSTFDFIVGDEATEIAFIDPLEFENYHVPIQKFYELAHR